MFFRDLTQEEAEAAMDEFGHSDITSIRNKSAFLMSILRSNTLYTCIPAVLMTVCCGVLVSLCFVSVGLLVVVMVAVLFIFMVLLWLLLLVVVVVVMSACFMSILRCVVCSK